MAIIDKWYQLATRMKPQFIIKLGFVWWKNVIELCKTILKQWWPLLIVLLAAYSGYLKIFFDLILTGNGLAHLLMVRLAKALLLSITLGIWFAVILSTVHTSMFPKKEFYRSHPLYFLGATALIAGAYLYFVAMPIGFFPTNNPLPAPKYSALIELYLIFSSFFLLDAHVTVHEYLRALTILPIKLLIFNLPLTVLLYLLLIPIHWASSGISVMLLSPLFIVACEIVYKLTINSNYEDYYGTN